jgi:hypothetical protein
MSIYREFKISEDIINTLENIEKRVAPFLERIPITFPQFTDHGVKHSKRIIKILRDTVLDQDNVDYLIAHPWTLFFLLASALLHDIGMVDFSEMHIDNDNLTPEEIRKYHGDRSDQIIKCRWSDFGIGDIFQARILGEISRHHTGPLDSQHFIGRCGYLTETVNVGFCVACLRLADELDLTKSRVEWELVEFITNPVSKNEWMAHYSIGAAIPHPNLKRTILVDCISQTKEAHRKLKSLETKINKLLALISTHVEPRLLYTQCLFQIEAKGYVDTDLKFTVEENSLWPIIIGDILYHDKRIFIRELIQNSIDACLLRKYRESEYEPHIDLFYNLGSIKIIDNGCGMDLPTIEKYLTRICISFYQSERFIADKPVHFYPISRFGIGILSCFMVASEIQIKTSTGNGHTYTLTIKDVRDYIHIEYTDKLFTGTEIIVTLRKKLAGVISFLRDAFRHTDLPITYHYPLGDLETLGLRPFSKKEMILFGNHEYEKADEYRISFSVSEGYLWHFPINMSKKSKQTNGQFLLLMNGIKIGIFSLLPAWCILEYIEGIVNLRNQERIDITASRNEIVHNDKYITLIKHIENCLVGLLSEKLKSLSGNPAEINTTFNKAVRADLATDALVPLIKDHYYFKLYEIVHLERYRKTDKFRYVSFTELQAQFQKDEIYNDKKTAHLNHGDYRLYNLIKDRKLIPI